MLSNFVNGESLFLACDKTFCHLALPLSPPAGSSFLHFEAADLQLSLPKALRSIKNALIIRLGPACRPLPPYPPNRSSAAAGE